ncbi:MAG: thiamine-monophosphate kinase [Planctomycetaceae bacterium]|nr:thiamine-monophosphate kinase [Planctomycetaceae bacterium]
MSQSTQEFGLIDWFRQHAASNDRLDLGIGDDTAIVNVQDGRRALLAVDMLLEGVHFTCPPAEPHEIGRKALAVNLSDIAAMACIPTACVVSVAIRRDLGPEFAREVHRGLNELAEQFHVALAGGDTNVWDKPSVISVTVMGEEPAGGAILRSGAQVGDSIFVTGELGGSLAGHHLSFTPRVTEALELRKQYDIHAMIDVSDGISSDLPHILDESNVGATLDANAIPISDAAKIASDDRRPLDHALHDGEDFELLFTLSEADSAQLIAAPPAAIRISKIGEIEDSPGCRLRDASGASKPLERRGWEHGFAD